MAPARIADERRIHDLLEAHGLPVPEERAQLIDEYLYVLPRIYAIGTEALVAAGFDVPTTAEGVALDAFRAYERVHDRFMPVRDPVAVFLRRWLHRWTRTPPTPARPTTRRSSACSTGAPSAPTSCWRLRARCCCATRACATCGRTSPTSSTRPIAGRPAPSPGPR